MLKLDHVPFVARTNESLRSSFEELGFTCSPSGIYTSKEYPGTAWPCVCVFLEQGWFDLLEDPHDSIGEIGRPSGCLYSTNNLEESIDIFEPEAVSQPYSLERNWTSHESPRESFRLASVKASLFRLPIAIIENLTHRQSIEKKWLNHANSAIALEGVYCSSEERQENLTVGIDGSQARNVAPEAFAERFKTNSSAFGVRVRVRSMDDLLSCLSATSIENRRLDSRVLAYPTRVDCVFEFIE